MGLLQEIAATVLVLSFFTFVALFGRIPALRKTPIGFLYRVIWIHTPKFLSLLTTTLCGPRVLQCWIGTGNYLMNENHPLVLIFFLVLLVGSEVIFIPSAWPRVTTVHRVCIPIIATLPYILLYVSVKSKSSITPENHGQQMRLYPYDRVLYHPGRVCRTCKFLKPARSRHCSLCKTCVSRHDHHCIWLSNCVGRNNYPYFIALLLAMFVLLAYGAYLGHSLLDRNLHAALFRKVPEFARTRHWSKDLKWITYFQLWGLAIADDIRIGAVFLLSMLTAPLPLGMAVYHLYLIWAGMTTSESSRWSDWKEDIADGIVYSAKRSEIFGDSKNAPWPVEADQVLMLSEDPPRIGHKIYIETHAILQPEEDANAEVDPRWTRVEKVRNVVNIYDLGFWANVKEMMRVHLG